MNDKHDHEVVEMMARYGGGFVKTLSACFFHADDDNVRRLKVAFPEYWSQYEELADMRRKADALDTLQRELHPVKPEPAAGPDEA